MIGDRYLIDTVFGNKNGMLTIRPSPLTEKGEPKAVLAVRDCLLQSHLFLFIFMCSQ